MPIHGRLASDGVPRVGNYSGTVHSNIAVLPKGSAWARNPIPDDTSRTGNQCREFPPPCEEVPDCEPTKFQYDQDATCRCSGAWGPCEWPMPPNLCPTRPAAAPRRRAVPVAGLTARGTNIAADGTMFAATAP